MKLVSLAPSNKRTYISLHGKPMYQLLKEARAPLVLTTNLMMWKGEKNSLTTQINTKAKRYKYSENSGQLQVQKIT